MIILQVNPISQVHELRDANEELEEFKRIADERGVSKVDLEKELIGLREQVNDFF